MTTDELRAVTETKAATLLRRLNKAHRARVMAAIEAYGSVEAIPLEFWEQIKREVDNELAALFLLLMTTTYTSMTQQVARVAKAGGPIEIPSEDQIRTAAAKSAATLGRETARSFVDNTRSRLHTAWLQSQTRVDRTEARKVFEREVVDIMPTRPNPEKLDAADTAAITNTTRGISAAEMAAANDEGTRRGVQVDVRWVTEKDSKVCPICAPLNSRPSIEWVDQFPSGPPAHPNCLLPGTIVSARDVVAAFRFWYDGPAVTIRTAKGRRFSVTTNHPIVTASGFVPAGNLVVGQDLVDARVMHPSCSPSVDPKKHYGPACIEEVFGSLRKSRGVATCCVPTAAEHFHGEGVFGVGNVEIVATNRLLRHARESAGFQHFNNLPMAATWSGPEFSRLGDLDAMLVAVSLASHGCVGRLSELLSFKLAGSSHSRVHSGRAAADWNSQLDETVVDGSATHADGLGECFDAFAGIVSTDYVVNVERFDFRGHVFDLQTSSGVYCTDAIVSSNCRCRLAPYVQGDNDGGDKRPTDARREPALPYSILPGETNPL